MTDSKDEASPAKLHLSSGAPMFASWTVMVLSAIVGGCVSLAVFPSGAITNEQLHGAPGLKGIAIILLFVLSGQFAFCRVCVRSTKAK